MEAEDLLPGRITDPAGADPVREAVEHTHRFGRRRLLAHHHPTVAAVLPLATNRVDWCPGRAESGTGTRRTVRSRGGAPRRRHRRSHLQQPRTRPCCRRGALTVGDFHVIVVDSASSDDTLETIADLPVTGLALGENRGFAHACNAGWQKRGGATCALPESRCDDHRAVGETARGERLTSRPTSEPWRHGSSTTTVHLTSPCGGFRGSLRRSPRRFFSIDCSLEQPGPTSSSATQMPTPARRRPTGSLERASSSSGRFSSNSTGWTKGSSCTARTSICAGASEISRSRSDSTRTHS